MRETGRMVIEGKVPEIGDYVWLRSGSPRMMVVDLPHPSSVTVAWAGDDGAPMEAEFRRACLSRFPH